MSQLIVTKVDLARYVCSKCSTTRKEQLERLSSAWEVLYWQAVRMRELVTQQYRGFKVGCAVLAFRDDVSIMEGRWQFFSGMNAKISPTSRPVCAESVAIGSAYAAGYHEIIGMVVVDQPQQDEYSGLYPPTLHPCHDCRTLMRSHPVVSLRTRILTAHPPEEKQEPEQELHSLRRLLKIHNEL